jgi:hypothetical protein
MTDLTILFGDGTSWLLFGPSGHHSSAAEHLTHLDSFPHLIFAHSYAPCCCNDHNALTWTAAND